MLFSFEYVLKRFYVKVLVPKGEEEWPNPQKKAFYITSLPTQKFSDRTKINSTPHSILAIIMCTTLFMIITR